MKKKLLIIFGPTAVGKTALASKLVKKFNGEIISADSRQVYKGMDIVTGKDRPIGIPIWGLDLINPDQEFSVAHWLKFSNQTLLDIWKRGKLPIVVGGTGFWIKALISGVDSLGIPPDWKLREKLSNLKVEKLKEMLSKLDSKRFKNMNQSDKNNPRRLIRAIEIVKVKSQKLKVKAKNKNLNLKDCNYLVLALKTSNKLLAKKISDRVDKRINQGAEKEVRNLINKGYLWDLPSMSAIGYQHWQLYLTNKASLAEVVKRWKQSELAYTKDQLLWLKKIRPKKVIEVKGDYYKRVEKFIKSWYDKNCDGKN